MRSASASTSPTTGSNAEATSRSVSGESGAESTEVVADLVCDNNRSNGSERRGNTSPVASHVPARVAPSASSSSSSSWARSRIRRGSTSSTRAPSGNKSGRRCSSAVSQGSQDSMPSKVCPSASRSHCSRPHGADASSSAARERTSSVGSSSRHGKIETDSSSCVLRWSPTANSETRSTSSPHWSIRIGCSAVAGNTSTIEPRTATSPRPSTWYSRRYPIVTSEATERVAVEGVAGAHRDRFHRFHVRTESLHQGAHRCDHDRRCVIAARPEPPHDPQPATHRFQRR